MGCHILNIVLLDPPAPAALVLLGLAFALFSFKSAAARRLIAVAGPPGGFGDDGRPVEGPELGVFTGEVGRGEDYDCQLALVAGRGGRMSSRWLRVELN